jgi:hypothetical protein
LLWVADTPRQTGRVSPRNSSRGGGNGDSASKKSASPIHPSSLAREVSAGNSGNDRSGSTSQSQSRSPITPPGGMLPPGTQHQHQSASTTGTTGMKRQAGDNGGLDSSGSGSGSGGGSGTQMSSIREERETSA